jgi:hypothetical protein
MENMKNVLRGPERTIPLENISLGRYMYKNIKKNGDHVSLVSKLYFFSVLF